MLIIFIRILASAMASRMANDVAGLSPSLYCGGGTTNGRTMSLISCLLPLICFDMADGGIMRMMPSS
uniref:Secreted protein n=1 Tax=Oryza rufipogon TaxID=4529 RepID=A0A0E0P8N4_ORYRU